MQFSCVYNGKLNLKEPQKLKDYLTRFKPDDQLVLTIEKRKRPRSNQQNKYYWSGILGTISLDTGHTPLELHEVFKQLFLPRRFMTIGEKEVEITGTTTNLSTKEFGEYVEKIIIYASSELSILIPSPDDYMG